LRWDEKVDSQITDRVKPPVILALDGAITMDREIDLEEEYQFSHAVKQVGRWLAMESSRDRSVIGEEGDQDRS